MVDPGAATFCAELSVVRAPQPHAVEAKIAIGTTALQIKRKPIRRLILDSSCWTARPRQYRGRAPYVSSICAENEFICLQMVYLAPQKRGSESLDASHHAPDGSTVLEKITPVDPDGVCACPEGSGRGSRGRR